MAVLAGCGSSTAPPVASIAGAGGGHSHTAGVYSKAFLSCMQEHGVDLSGDGVALNRPDPDTESAAGAACSDLAPIVSAGGGGLPPPALVKHLLAFAECLRANGLPDVQDPTVAKGGVEMTVPPAEADTPQFKTAMNKCQSLEAFGSPSPSP
jgi:hypothetical protein